MSSSRTEIRNKKELRAWIWEHADWSEHDQPSVSTVEKAIMDMNPPEYGSEEWHGWLENLPDFDLLIEDHNLERVIPCMSRRETDKRLRLLIAVLAEIGSGAVSDSVYRLYSQESDRLRAVKSLRELSILP